MQQLNIGVIYARRQRNHVYFNTIVIWGHGPRKNGCRHNALKRGGNLTLNRGRFSPVISA